MLNKSLKIIVFSLAFIHSMAVLFAFNFDPLVMDFVFVTFVTVPLWLQALSHLLFLGCLFWALFYSKRRRLALTSLAISVPLYLLAGRAFEVNLHVSPEYVKSHWMLFERTVNASGLDPIIRCECNGSFLTMTDNVNNTMTVFIGEIPLYSLTADPLLAQCQTVNASEDSQCG
uniref:hypothetical protein n=1 Tax=Thaumasiovibrio occultus TaxID=1891184 RepID=UPI000B35503C|nr:hypothetical protein [Thaumasiovibrio occultus]